MSEQKIQCPHCGTSISIDDVLTHQIEEKIKKSYTAAQKKQALEYLKKLEAVKKESIEISEAKKNMDLLIAEKLSEQLKSERAKITQQAKIAAEQEQNDKQILLQEQLNAKDRKLAEARKNEIELLREKSQLKEEKDAFELEKIRQLEEAKKNITETAEKKAAEEQQYKMAELEKKISDVTKANSELTRKLAQGSQQTQGEVLELALEEILTIEFPHDEISPVPKGVTGADIIQKVIDRTGRVCGLIAWETKNTKGWNKDWIQKLKDDQRTIKADLAVLVSATLPEDVKGFVFRDGVWICDIKLIIPLAIALRMNLESITREKNMSIGKNEKMEVLYSYLTGVEFKQRVEAIVEAFTHMDTDLKQERMAYERIWAKREKQIKKVITNTIGMYGDLSGLVTLPQIKMLELGE